MMNFLKFLNLDRLKNVLETVDFSKINKSKLREIFLRLSPECSVDDIGILIDRGKVTRCNR